MAGPSRFRVRSNNLGVPQVLLKCPRPTLHTGRLVLTYSCFAFSDILILCHSFFLAAPKKDMNLPILFQVPDVLSKVLNYFLIEKKPEAINSSRMTEYEYKGMVSP